MAKKSGSKRTTGKRKAVAQKKKPASKKSKTAGKKLVIKIGNKKLGRKQRKNAKKVEETSSEEEESEESSEEESSDEEETSEEEEESSDEDEDDTSSSEDDENSSENSLSSEDEEVKSEGKKRKQTKKGQKNNEQKDENGTNSKKRLKIRFTGVPNVKEKKEEAKKKEEIDYTQYLQKVIGTKFKRRFAMIGVFTGEVVSFRILPLKKGKKPQETDLLFQVKYNDGDEEELDAAELARLGVDIPYQGTVYIQNPSELEESPWPLPDSCFEDTTSNAGRVPFSILGDVVSCWRFVTRFSNRLSLSPLTLLQLEEALAYNSKDAIKQNDKILYNKVNARLIDEMFQSLLSILLNEEVAEETEELDRSVGNRETHTRGGIYATRLDLMNDATWLEILRQTVTEGESLNLPTIWSEIAGCQEVLANMFEYEEEITDDKTFSSKMDSTVYEDLEKRIPNPLDMRTIEGRINSGWYINNVSKGGGSDAVNEVEGTAALERTNEQIKSKQNGHNDNNNISKSGATTNTKGGGPIAFASDMRTIFNNYLELEERDTTLYNAAKEMKSEFNRLYKQYVEEPFLNSRNKPEFSNDEMVVDNDSDSDDGDSSDEDEEEDEYDEEWVQLRRTAIAAARYPFHQLELNQKVRLLKWLCDEVMESDAIREEMDEMHEKDKDLRREREMLKKRMRKFSKDNSSTMSAKSAFKTRFSSPATTTETAATKYGNPNEGAAKPEIIKTDEQKAYEYSKANYEGRKHVGSHFKKKIEGHGFQPGLIIKYTAAKDIEKYKEDSKFVIRFNDGTIVENVPPVELFLNSVPIKLHSFGFTTEEIYDIQFKANESFSRGRGRPPKDSTTALKKLKEKATTAREFKMGLRKLKAELRKINEKLAACAKLKVDLPYGCDRRGNRYWHFKEDDGVGRLFIENGGTGEWRAIESKASFLKLLKFLSRRSKVENDLLNILETIKPILLSMWSDKDGVEIATVRRNAGQSLMPPVFFQLKLCSRPYDITISDGGRIKEVLIGGLGHSLGLQRHDTIVGLGSKGQMGNYLIDFSTTSHAVVNEILKHPADDTCMYIARGEDFRPYCGDVGSGLPTDGKKATYFYERKIVNNGEIKRIRDISIIQQLKLGNGGRILEYGDLKLSEYEEHLEKQYAVDEFGNRKHQLTSYGVKGTVRYGETGTKEAVIVLPNEFLPGDYICRVNDFEVNLETTEKEIFDVIRNILLPRTNVGEVSKKKATRLLLRRKSDAAGKDDPEKIKAPVLRLVMARNHHPSVQHGKMYKPLTTSLYKLEPAPEVFWRTFTNVDVGMDMKPHGYGCRIRNVYANGTAEQLGILPNDQIVQVGTRDLNGNNRNALIWEWIKTDISRSQNSEVVLKFARAHPNSKKQTTDPCYLADIVNGAGILRYPVPYYLYRNDYNKFESYREQVLHSAISTSSLRKFLDKFKSNPGNYLTVARQWVCEKTRIVNLEMVRYLHEEAYTKIEAMTNESMLMKPLDHWKECIFTLHQAIAPAMTASALKPAIDPKDSVVLDWIRTLRNSSRSEILSACSFGQLALLIEKLYRASKCFSLISKEALLSKIAVENQAWVPEADTFVIFSAFVYNRKKYTALLKEEDFLGLVPKYGCFEMHVKSRQIVVSKSGRIFWKFLLKPRSKKQTRSYMSLMPPPVKKKRGRKPKKKLKEREATEKTKKNNFIDNSVSNSKKKKGYVRKEYKGLNVLESNMLTFIKLVYVHPDAPPFLEAVDSTVIRDYVDWVKKPMYLKLIRSNIKAHKYRTAYELMNDLKLIRDNCVHYCHSVNLYLDIPPAAERMYLYARQEMGNLIRRGTFLHPEVEQTMEIMLGKITGEKASSIHYEEDINVAVNLMKQYQKEAKERGDIIMKNGDDKKNRGFSATNFTKILDVPHPNDKLPGPVPPDGGVQFMAREKIMINTNKHGKIYGYMNTLTCQITSGNGEVFSSPTKFISKFRSTNAHPNNDIIFCKTGETLGNARFRGACRSNKNSKYSINKKNYTGPRGAHSIEKGPTPTRGRQLSLLSEVTCKLKAGGSNAVGILNTRTGMIVLDQKTGESCTPGEWCIRVKAARLNPNRGIKLAQTSESLMNGKDRNAVKSIEGEADADYNNATLNSLADKGPKPKYGKRFDVMSPATVWGMDPRNNYKQRKIDILINTNTSMIHYRDDKGKDATCTPAEYCLKIKSESKNPNKEIKFNATGETLRVARLRNACFTIESEKNDVFENVDEYVDLGPVPSSGKRLRHVTEIYGIGKSDRYYAFLDTRSGMIIIVTSDLAEDEGNSSLKEKKEQHSEIRMTPREFCEKIDSQTLNPNTDIIIRSSKENLGKAKKRAACSLLEGETSVDNSFELNGNGPDCTRGPRLREFEKIYFQYEVQESKKNDTDSELLHKLGMDAWKKKCFDRVYMRINTVTGMIIGDSDTKIDSSGKSSDGESAVVGKLPLDTLTGYKTATNNPNLEFVLEKTNEQLGNARLRGAIKTLETEMDFDGVKKKEYESHRQNNGDGEGIFKTDRPRRSRSKKSYKQIPLYSSTKKSAGAGLTKCPGCNANVTYNGLAAHKRNCDAYLRSKKYDPVKQCIDEVIAQVSHDPEMTFHSMVRDGLYSSVEELIALIPPLKPEDDGPTIARTRFSTLYAFDREGQKRFGVMDTTSRKLFFDNEEYSPTKFVRRIVTQKGWPNIEVKFLSTGESLGDARARGAVQPASARAPRAQLEKETEDQQNKARRLSKRDKKQSAKVKENNATMDEDDSSSGSSGDDEPISFISPSARRVKKTVNYNESALVQQDEEKIKRRQKEQESKEKMAREKKEATSYSMDVDTGHDDGYESHGNEDGSQGADETESKRTKFERLSKVVPFADTLNIRVDQIVRSYARQDMTIYVPMELSDGVNQVLFDIEKYKELNEKTDEKLRAANRTSDIMVESSKVSTKYTKTKTSDSTKTYEAQMKKILTQEKRLREKADKAQYKEALALIRTKKKDLNKQILQQKKEQRELNRLKLKKLRELQDIKKAKTLPKDFQESVMSQKEILAIKQLEQDEAEQRACQCVIDFIIAEVEEMDWISKVPQPPRTDMYYSTTRYLTNALMRSRLVNIPKTQAMFDYESLSRQWYDNFDDRINGANDLIMSVAAHQVIYYDGLRFQDEMQSIKDVLPKLRERVVDSIKKLETTIGNKKQWDLCQSQIAEAGKSEVIQIHDKYNIVYKKVQEKYVKRVRQSYRAQKTQPRFVPKFQQLRNSYDEARLLKQAAHTQRIAAAAEIDAAKAGAKKAEEEYRRKLAEKKIVEKKNELKRIESELKRAKKSVEKLDAEAKGINGAMKRKASDLDGEKMVKKKATPISTSFSSQTVAKSEASPFPTLVDGRRVVCYIENKRFLPKKRKEPTDSEAKDPRRPRVWGKGLPMVENIVLRKEKGKHIVPKRRRVVCVIGGNRVDRKQKESFE